MTENSLQTMPASTPAVTPSDLLRMAVESNADIDKLGALMDLQERWEKKEARKAYVLALAAFKKSPPTIDKNKSASFGGRSGGNVGYEYASLDHVVKAVGSALSGHGLTHTWEVNQTVGGPVEVTCVLTHVGGHSERVTLHAGADTSGSKNNIQAIGSTISYLERYTLLAITGLATSEMDMDAMHTDEVISAEQKEAIIAKMKETGAETQAFLRYLEVDVLDHLPASEFDRAMTALAKKQQSKKAVEAE